VPLGGRSPDTETSLCTLISSLGLPRLIREISLTAFRQSRNSSVGIVTKQAGGQQMNHAWISSMCKRLFFPPKHTNRLLEPIQPPLHCATGVKLSQREAVTHFLLVSRLRMSELKPPFPPYFHVLYTNNFTLPSFDVCHSAFSYEIAYVKKTINLDSVSTYIEVGGSKSS